MINHKTIAEHFMDSCVKYIEVLMMKKTFALSLLILLTITANTGCASSQDVSEPEPSVVSESPQAPTPPNTYLPQVMIGGAVYVLHGNPYLEIESLPESYYKGQILSTVPLSEKPTKNGEANFNVEEGMPYASYGKGYIVLWNDVWTLFVTPDDYLRDAMPTPGIVGGAPISAPTLDVELITGESKNQRVEALKLTTSWSVSYEDGSGIGYEADSPHPLQLRKNAFDEATLSLNNVSGEIVLHFSGDYPPQSITAQRWPTKFAYDGQDSSKHIDDGEPVALSGNSIYTDDDGSNYIYEISASWPEGRSHYTFRVFTGRQD